MPETKMPNSLLAVITDAVIKNFMNIPSENNPRNMPKHSKSDIFQSVASNIGYIVGNILWKALKFLLLFQIILTASVCIYGLFYSYMMPDKLYKRPLHFDYGMRGLQRAKNPPTANVFLHETHTQWTPGENFPISPASHRKLLVPKQDYAIDIELKLPQSGANERVGVFMLLVHLFDDKKNELGFSARPTFLPHSSTLVRTLRVLTFWPIFTLGIWRESESILVPCIDYFEEREDNPLTNVKVQISSPDIQIYNAHLIVSPQLKGLPWIMNNFFYTSATAGISAIALILSSVFGFLYLVLSVEDKNVPKRKNGLRPLKVRTQLRSSISESNPAGKDDAKHVPPIQSELSVTNESKEMKRTDDDSIDDEIDTEQLSVDKSCSSNWVNSLDSTLRSIEKQGTSASDSKPLLTSGSKYSARHLG